MNFERYDYKKSPNFLDYTFYSEGPKGRIKKIVRYNPENTDGVVYFNLILGDWDNKKKKIDDMVITNNRDTKKVLATVAATLLTFIQHFPGALIYARGSTFPNKIISNKYCCKSETD